MDNKLQRKILQIGFALIICFAVFSNTRINVIAENNENNTEDMQDEVSEIDLGDYQSQMKVGEKQLLTITVLPENAVYTELTYASSNPAVAKINGMGRITALEPGITEISVSCGMVTEKFVLSVVSGQVEVIDLDIADCPSEIVVGSSQLLNVTTIPANIEDYTINYVSGNPAVATVNAVGRVTGVSVGKTDIFITCGNITKTIGINVVDSEGTEKKVTKIEIASHEDELEVDKTMTLYVTVLPSDATDNSITYKSSDERVATVSSTGEIKGISAGKVTITVTAGDISEKVELKVKYATTKIEMNTTYLVMHVGDTFQLTASVKPKEADNVVGYRSVNENIVSVSSAGLVTAKKCGSGTIIVKNSDTSTAVTVVVNDGITKETVVDEENVQTDVRNYENVIYEKDCSLITADMLRYYYENQLILTIYGDGYSMQIDGKKLHNWNNEMYTGIQFVLEREGTSFIVNQGNNICGPITLQIDENRVSGKYLYLYNEAKNKYELINQSDIHRLELDSAGKYLITNNKIQRHGVKIIVILAAFLVIVAMIIAYILVKKRYWFW